MILACLGVQEWCGIRGTARSFDAAFAAISRTLWRREHFRLRALQTQADIHFYNTYMVMHFALWHNHFPNDSCYYCPICRRIVAMRPAWLLVGAPGYGGIHCVVCARNATMEEADQGIDSRPILALSTGVIDICQFLRQSVTPDVPAE